MCVTGWPMRRNPLAGIRYFLTHENSLPELKGATSRNPLAGIRCFLTESKHNVSAHNRQPSQSPGGDSLFSDAACAAPVSVRRFRRNSLAGIHCFLTGDAATMQEINAQ